MPAIAPFVQVFLLVSVPHQTKPVPKQYIFEETAVFSLMFRERPAVDIYPGTLLFMWNLFAQGALPGAPEGLEKGCFTRIDFLRNKNPQRPMASPSAPPMHRLM
jgi:hypothetical protein